MVVVESDVATQSFEYREYNGAQDTSLGSSCVDDEEGWDVAAHSHFLGFDHKLKIQLHSM